MDEKLPHVLQVSWYAIKLKKPKAGDTYISKDDLCMKPYQFPVTTDIKNKLVKEITTLRHYWEKDILPPPEPRAYGGKECKYCPFKTKCGKGDVK